MKVNKTVKILIYERCNKFDYLAILIFTLIFRRVNVVKVFASVNVYYHNSQSRYGCMPYSQVTPHV